MLGSNPSADSGAQTEDRVARHRPAFFRRDWRQCDRTYPFHQAASNR